MRLSLVRYMLLRLMLAAAIVGLGEPELLACSGPRAARTIGQSILLGWTLGGISLAIVARGRTLLLRRSQGPRSRWILILLAFHPTWWMSATHGDCGYGLRFWSMVATLSIAVAVALATCWPRRVEAEPKLSRWALSGALAGAFAGLPIAAVVSGGPYSMSVMNLSLGGLLLCSIVVAGALVGGDLFRHRNRAGHRFLFSLRTLLLLPAVLAPLFVVFLPVLPYQASVSTTSPFRFVVVDEATGQPIPNAAIQLVDPRFAPDDAENQGVRVVTGADGSVEYFLFANSHGRQGLLGQTETITYNPWLIRVEAPGYRPFVTSLAGDAPIPREQLTARPLGLTFPPPPSVTIRLSPSTGADGAEGNSSATNRSTH